MRGHEDHQEPKFLQGHCEDLEYMEKNTYVDLPFFIRAITNDSGTSFTYFGDMQKNLFYISDNMREKFGFDCNIVPNLLEKWQRCIFTEDGRQNYLRDLQSMIDDKRVVHDMRYQVVDARGNMFWIRCYGNLKWNEDQTKPLFFAGRITRQDEVFLVDPVSNYPGESVMLRHLAMLSARGEHCPVIGFSLNHIAQINSVQGRTYSNKLINLITTQLAKTLYRRMNFYKLDGMKFMAIMLPHSQETVEENIQDISRIVQENYQGMGILLSHPCSFAVMDFPQTDLTPIDFQENLISLLRFAHLREDKLYVEDKDQNIFHEQEISNLELLLHRNVLEGMTDFRPVVQPVVNAKTGKVVGGETLMRWRNGGTEVSPGIFISLLERGELIYPVGRWIFEQAVTICKKMVAVVPDFYLTVNVSLKQLHDEGFADFMADTLKKHDLAGEHIVIEMTESCMDQEPEKLRQLVDACARMRVRIALDDFGSGYSSLRVLLKYPSAIIKLDRSLLLEMTESEDKLNFISSIVFACHRVGKTVCIEGVETEVQRALAEEAGCDMIQGFYYFRPTEIESLESVIRSNLKL